MDALRRLVGALRSASRTAVREAGVTGAQLFVLQQLAAEPGQSVTRLAERTSTRQNSVSDVVARLAREGFVTRTPAPDDARRAVVSLTAAGRAAVRSAAPAPQALLVDSFRRLPASHRHSLAKGLELWITAAGLAELPPTMFFEPLAASRPRAKRAVRGRAQ